MAKAITNRQISHYFEYSSHGIEVLQDGLQEVRFGEYLIEQGCLTPTQLMSALQMQDRQPNVPVGECAAALGFLPRGALMKQLTVWEELEVVEV